jgi:hypothetical protein
MDDICTNYLLLLEITAFEKLDKDLKMEKVNPFNTGVIYPGT